MTPFAHKIIGSIILVIVIVLMRKLFKNTLKGEQIAQLILATVSIPFLAFGAAVILLYIFKLFYYHVID